MAVLTGAERISAEPRAAMLRGAARGGVANLAGTAFAGTAGVAVTWLVARALDTVAAGAFFSATATFVLGTAIAKLGTQTSLVYWPARLRARGQRGALARCLRVGLTPVAVASVAVAVGLWLTAGFAHPPAYAGQLRILAVLVPAAALADALLAATRGYRAMRPTVLLDRVLRPGAQLAALSALLLMHVSAPGLFALAWSAPYLPVALLAGYALARAHRAETAPHRAAGAHDGRDRDDDRAGDDDGARDGGFGPAVYWRFTAPRAVASAAQLALQRVDVLLVAALAGFTPAAMYAVAGRFVVLGQLVNQALSQAVQPRLAEHLATGDTTGTNALYRQGTAWLVLTTWPLYLCVAGYPAVYLGLFGDRYRAGAPIVVVLAAAMLVATGCGMVDMVLAMGGRTGWNLANVAVALAVMITIDVAAIPRLGALGAALGLGAAVVTNNLLPLVQVWRGLGVHPFGRATLTAAALAAGCFGVPAMSWQLATLGPDAALPSGHPRTLAAAVAVLAGTAGYLAGLFGLRRLFTASVHD